MDNLMNLFLAPVSWPVGGVLETILGWFAGIGSFGLAIILFSICIKLIQMPLEYWNKLSSRQMSLQNAKIKPELDEIKEKYKDNPNLAQQKQAEVYKKNNINPMKGCASMIVYMIVTMVIFITVFNALGNISRTKTSYEYYQLEQTYIQTYEQYKDATDYDTDLYETANDYAIAKAQEKAAEKFNEIKESFLTIKNIWRADTWTSVIPSADEFFSSSGVNFSVAKNESSAYNNYVFISTQPEMPYTDFNNNVYVVSTETELENITINGKEYNVIVKATENEIIEEAKKGFTESYNLVTARVSKNYAGQWNGYLFLIILSVAIVFLSQYLSNLGIKAKDKDGNKVAPPKPNIIMGLVTAAIFVPFMINYTSAFALYLLTNSVVSILTNILINVIMSKVDERKENKETITADYVIKK